MPPKVAELARQPPPNGPFGRAGVRRPVVLLGPADGLRGASDAFSDRRWVCRLAAVTLTDPPEVAVDQLLARAEEVLADVNWDPRRARSEASRDREPGIAVFAGVTLGLPEGVVEGEAIDRFLRAGQQKLRRRGSALLVLPTAGSSLPGGAAAGGLVEAGAPSGAREPRTLAMRMGLSDVGLVAAAIYRSGE